MLFNVSGAWSRCCILSQEPGVGAVYCLRIEKLVLYIVSGARTGSFLIVHVKKKVCLITYMVCMVI